MADEHTIESIMVADCGTVSTKVLFLERVEESYRFVAQAEAPTTLHAPWNDISTGVVYAIEEIERITGRTLLSGGFLISPQNGMQGVDAFVVTLSAPEPLHLLVGGLVREMSLESARRAAAGTYTQIDTVLSREGNLHSPEEQWARLVRDQAPDVVLLVGGVDGGAARPVMELADAIALGLSMLEHERRPVLLYAGNSALRPALVKLIGDITRLEVVDNVRPSAEEEHLGPATAALERLYMEMRVNQTPGLDTLAAWSRLPLLPTATAFGHTVEYLWHETNQADRGALGIDLGAAHVTVAAVFEGRLTLSVHAQGAAYGPLAWAEAQGLEPLLRWLPEEIEPAEVWAWLYDRQLRPWTIPHESRELLLEQAALREMLRHALAQALPGWDPGKAQYQADVMPYLDPILISGGALTRQPRPGQILLTVLDGLEPVGISTILLDLNRAAAALGAVATVKPLAAAAALENGTLIPLGTVISPLGKGWSGEQILKMRITYDDNTTLDVEARYGELEIWPLLPGQRATLELRPSRRFDVGLGGPGRGGKVQALGGLVGLVVDGRGRPLELPEKADPRRKHLRRWLWDVGG